VLLAKAFGSRLASGMRSPVPQALTDSGVKWGVDGVLDRLMFRCRAPLAVIYPFKRAPVQDASCPSGLAFRCNMTTVLFWSQRSPPPRLPKANRGCTDAPNA
jgi:hypothetical protein